MHFARQERQDVGADDLADSNKTLLAEALICHRSTAVVERRAQASVRTRSPPPPPRVARGPAGLVQSITCRNTRPVIRPAEDIANSTVETVMSCLGPRVTINEMSS